ncbi:hypothetical protein ACFX2I_027679 [Malus domestica]
MLAPASFPQILKFSLFSSSTNPSYPNFCLVMDENNEKPKVGLMVMPSFWIGGSMIHCRVYLSGMKVAK